MPNNQIETTTMPGFFSSPQRSGDLIGEPRVINAEPKAGKNLPARPAKKIRVSGQKPKR